jgi:hypothetical protein
MGKRLKFQPSVYIAKEPTESNAEFTARILRDSRLLPDQRTSLEQDSNAAFSDYVQGIWLERPPIEIDEPSPSQPGSPP